MYFLFVHQNRIKYSLKLNKERLRIRLQSGKKKDGKYIWAPILIPAVINSKFYDFNEYIYGSVSVSIRIYYKVDVSLLNASSLVKH